MSKKNKSINRITPNQLPQEFLERLQLIAPGSYSQVERSFETRPTTLRINTIRADRLETLDQLKREGFKVNSVPWYYDAFILTNRSKRELTDTTVYKEGRIYLQSLASMVPVLVLDPKPGERVLDLTAAPGSKTSQIAAAMQCKGELIANDVNKIRFFKLKHNMELLGICSEEKTFCSLNLSDGYKLTLKYPEYFDKVLLDAPCSAEARFVKKDIKSYGYWSEKKIKEMDYKQRQLIFAAWGALKPGGVMVYSTCTFAPEENELQIGRLIEKRDGVEVLPAMIPNLRTLPILKEWKGETIPIEVSKCMRIFPTEQIEGFFVAKIRKSKLLGPQASSLQHSLS